MLYTKNCGRFCCASCTSTNPRWTRTARATTWISCWMSTERVTKLACCHWSRLASYFMSPEVTRQRRQCRGSCPFLGAIRVRSTNFVVVPINVNNRAVQMSNKNVTTKSSTVSSYMGGQLKLKCPMSPLWLKKRFAFDPLLTRCLTSPIKTSSSRAILYPRAPLYLANFSAHAWTQTYLSSH